MGKVIYENLTSKLVANANGGVILLTQYIDGKVTGEIAMYYEEAKELNDFIGGLDAEN